MKKITVVKTQHNREKARKAQKKSKQTNENSLLMIIRYWSTDQKSPLMKHNYNFYYHHHNIKSILHYRNKLAPMAFYIGHFQLFLAPRTAKQSEMASEPSDISPLPSGIHAQEYQGDITHICVMITEAVLEVEMGHKLK